MTTYTQNCLSPALNPLRPVTMLPQQITERPRALVALQRVESVEVRKRDAQKTFIFDVYHKLSRRRIPVVNSRAVCSRPASAAAPTSSRQVDPDYQAERTFAQIRRLRDAVYYAANSDHGLATCTYCSAVSDFVLLSSTTPHTAMQWLQGEDAQCKSLTSFIQQLVCLSIQVKSSRNGESCCGLQKISDMVAQFLQLISFDDPAN